MPATKLAKAVGVLFALALVPVATNEASAQVLVSGFTNGLFCASGPTCLNPNTNSLQQDFVLGTGGTNPTHRLTYSNSTFAGVTPTNNSGISFNAASSAFQHSTGTVLTQNSNNFGAFYMGGGIGVTYASPFTLWINLTSPTVGALTFTGALTGMAFVSPGIPGGVNLVFDTPSQGITVFSNGSWADITITNPAIAPEFGGVVTGTITAHVTPEPVTLSLLGTGLLGLVGVARRRRRNAANPA